MAGRTPDAQVPGDAAAASSSGVPRRPHGALARAVLGVLLADGPALTPRDVHRRLAELSSAMTEPGYTTVVTVLSRLHAQGVVTRSRVGRTFAYRPVADRPGLAARRMRRVLDDETDRDTVLARFVGDLSPHDEQVLRYLLGADLDA